MMQLRHQQKLRRKIHSKSMYSPLKSAVLIITAYSG